MMKEKDMELPWTPAEAEIDKQIKDLQEQKERLRSNRKWKCPSCGKGTAISKLTVQVVEYYVEPYSCTGGDYWTSGENPEYNIECPKCNSTVRETHCRSSYYNFVNYHIDNFKEKTWIKRQ
jgi:rubrerythrin